MGVVVLGVGPFLQLEKKDVKVCSFAHSLVAVQRFSSQEQMLYDPQKGNWKKQNKTSHKSFFRARSPDEISGVRKNCLTKWSHCVIPAH